MKERQIMKINHIDNIEKFFEVIDSCTGKVELVSDDLRLNLKSKLTQYVALAKIFSGGNEIPEMEIIAYNQDDVNKLITYMIG
jgi:hypothetical protein